MNKMKKKETLLQSKSAEMLLAFLIQFMFDRMAGPLCNPLNNILTKKVNS